MKKLILLSAMILVCQSAIARSPVKPIDAPAPACSDEFSALSKALNACPKEVRQVTEAYKFGAIRYIKADKSKVPHISNSNDAGDRVVIALKDSKDRFAGSLAVEFGPTAADGGPQAFNCKLTKVSSPIVGIPCTMEAVVCRADETKESYKNSDGCTKERCIPASTVIEQ